MNLLSLKCLLKKSSVLFAISGCSFAIACSGTDNHNKLKHSSKNMAVETINSSITKPPNVKSLLPRPPTNNKLPNELLPPNAK